MIDERQWHRRLATTKTADSRSSEELQGEGIAAGAMKRATIALHKRQAREEQEGGVHAGGAGRENYHFFKNSKMFFTVLLQWATIGVPADYTTAFRGSPVWWIMRELIIRSI